MLVTLQYEVVQPTEAGLGGIRPQLQRPEAAISSITNRDEWQSSTRQLTPPATRGDGGTN
jgi:hypothetical protein